MSKVGHERSTVVLGTRGSKLAVQQSEWVQAQLHALAPHVTVTLRKNPDVGRQDSGCPAGPNRREGTLREGNRGSAVKR